MNFPLTMVSTKYFMRRHFLAREFLAFSDIV